MPDDEVTETERVSQLRELLDERRQRAEELAVLNDLARRLASLRDPAVVLSEVARQARRLLAVDVAYIMLLQPEDVLRIEVVDGSMGSALRGIELDRDTGLGGEVLRTGQPLWSERYLDDTRFRHRGPIDAAASSEQLGGILGVPLIVDDETIGVLFAADRRPRTFADREIELLAALAGHAAVAIRNADLFERLTSANASRQRTMDLRERLTEVLINSGGYPALVAEMERVVGVPVRLRDADGHLLAGPPAGGARDGETTSVPVLLPSGVAGHLVALSDTLDDEAVRLLGIGATSAALVMAWERSLAEAELRSRGEFVSALLSADAEATSLRRRARSLGIHLDRIAVVAVLDPGSADQRAAAALAASLAAASGGWSAEHAGHLVLLVPGGGPSTVKQRIAELTGGRRLPAAIGLAGCAGGVPGVRAAYEAARQSATVLLALGRPADCVEETELGIYRSLFSQAGRDEIRRFVELTIGPLLAHDSSRQRDLAHTLATYLEQAQHHARTCAALHIHANTLYQRLDRITELIGPDWKDPARSLDVALALRLHTLMGRVVE